MSKSRPSGERQKDFFQLGRVRSLLSKPPHALRTGESQDAALFSPMRQLEAAMRFTLTDEQHLMLELIADGPVPAIPEIELQTAPLKATKLIALTDEMKWQITQLGEAMLERRRHLLH